MTQTRGQAATSAAASAAASASGRRAAGPRLEPRAAVRLTGRGALAGMFALCFFTQLIADWTGWGTLAGAAFVCGCGAITYYTRTSGLRSVVVAPPLLFFAGATCAEFLTAPGTFLAAAGLLVTLGTTAPWLYTGTALTIVVAIGRGYRPGFRRPRFLRPAPEARVPFPSPSPSPRGSARGGRPGPGGPGGR